MFKRLTFSSYLSNNADNNNPTFYLNTPISQIEGYSFQNFSGINTIYNIDSRNNTLNFIEDDSSSTIRSITIPTGNYTISSFLTSLSSLFTAAGTVVYTATNDTLVNKITITGASKTFKIVNSSNFCLESGFVSSASFAISQTAANTFDLSGIKILNLVCYSFGNTNSVLVNRNYNVIQSIPITTPYLGVIDFQSNSDIFITSQIQELNVCQFSLLDELARPVQINSPWSVSIVFNIN